MSESSSPVPSAKLNVIQPNTNVSNPSSPQINRRSSPTPQSASSSSFPNPFQEQQTEANSRLKQEPQTNDDIAVGTLLDITGDDTNHPQSQPTTLTNTENDLFDLNIDTQPTFSAPQSIKTTDLLGVDFNSMSLDKPILHRNASETVLPVPLQATSVSMFKTEPKSSSNQTINRSDPFKDLFSSSTTTTTQQTSSNESLAAKQAAGKNSFQTDVAHFQG